jgi:hypothetical protein
MPADKCKLAARIRGRMPALLAGPGGAAGLRGEQRHPLECREPSALVAGQQKRQGGLEDGEERFRAAGRLAFSLQQTDERTLPGDKVPARAYTPLRRLQAVLLTLERGILLSCSHYQKNGVAGVIVPGNRGAYPGRSGPSAGVSSPARGREQVRLDRRREGFTGNPPRPSGRFSMHRGSSLPRTSRRQQ